MSLRPASDDVTNSNDDLIMVEDKVKSYDASISREMPHSSGSTQKWRNLRWLLKLARKDDNKARSSKTLPSFYRTRFMLEDAVTKLREMDSDDYFSKVTNSYKYHGILDPTDTPERASSEIAVDDVIINGFSQQTLTEQVESDVNDASDSGNEHRAPVPDVIYDAQSRDVLNVTSGSTDSITYDSDDETYVTHL